jgi:hypothetical protein
MLIPFFFHGTPPRLPMQHETNAAAERVNAKTRHGFGYTPCENDERRNFARVQFAASSTDQE